MLDALSVMAYSPSMATRKPEHTPERNGQNGRRFWDAAFCAALTGLVNRRLKPGYVCQLAALYADAAVAERRMRLAK
jgi:hypothetical protein